MRVLCIIDGLDPVLQVLMVATLCGIASIAGSRIWRYLLKAPLAPGRANFLDGLLGGRADSF